MATTRLSPAASLLRHSRLFSLPPPLPRPSHDPSTAVIFESDTATLPHPIQASIETTQASLARGDWGLKRSLPLQSTTGTTTPVIRIGAVDSADHITDFDSAADHTLTLRKWQEMDIPLTLPLPKTSVPTRQLPPSVFEDDWDRTEVGAQGTNLNPKRWKHGGPWLATKSNGEFEEYILKKVKGRRQEFLHFLRAKIREKQVATSRRDAMDNGENFETPPQLSEEDLKTEVIRLRHDRGQLYEWTWQFLDLPRLPSQQQKHPSEQWVPTVVGDHILGEGPPTTHPSAGLSYLRTSSHVPNHPILGPMSSKPPVLARVLQQPSSRRRGRLLYGVGGVVSEGPLQNLYRDLKDPRFTSLDLDSEGGPKEWVHPQQANIDSYGRVQLGVDKATDDSVALWEKQEDHRLLATSSPASGMSGSSDTGSRRVPHDSSLRLRDRAPPVREYLGQEASDERAGKELKVLIQDSKSKQVFPRVEAMDGVSQSRGHFGSR